MSKRFLFVLWAGGGNVPPQLALARRLVGRGHVVRILAPSSLRPVIETTGAVFEPYRSAPEHDEADPATSLIRDFEARTPLGAIIAARTRLLGGMAAPIAADTLAVLDQEAADVVVGDYNLVGAAFAGEKAGVPVAVLVHHVYPFPADGAPPFGTGWRPARGRLGALRDRFGYAMFDTMLVRPLREPLNAARRSVGLAPLASALDAFTSAQRVLVLTSDRFDFTARRPPNVVYVGPQLDVELRASTGASRSDGTPEVVVGLSTTYQRQGDLLRRIVRALGTLPVHATVTTGPIDLSPDEVPANVDVHRFVPHAEVIPGAAAVVTHAGHGTVMTALAHGVPVVCLPISRDQPDIAARVEHAGAGVRLSSRSRVATIATTISGVLDDRRLHDGARRLQRALAEDMAAQRAEVELETLAGVPSEASLHGVE